MEYSAKIDWQINNNVKQELVKRWIDVSKLRIACTKGVVEIKGELNFTGQLASEKEILTLVNRLKTTESALRGISYVRDIRWKLANWKKSGLRWNPTKEKK